MEGAKHLGGWMVVVVCLAAVVAAALLHTSTQRSREGLSDRFDNRGELAAAFIGEFVRQVADREAGIARQRLTRDIGPEAFSELVRDQQFEAAVLLDHDGQALRVHPHDPDLIGDDLARRYRHLDEASRGRMAVSDVVPSAAESAPIVAVAVPFQAPSGRRVFSSGFRIAQTPLDSFVRNSLPVDGSVAYVVDGPGTIVASSTGAKDVAGRSLGEEAPELADTPRSGSGEVEADGESAHFVSAPVAGTSWRVVASVPTATLYRPLRGVTLLQGSLLLVLVLLIGLVSLLVLRLVRAERRLHAQVLQLESANRTLDAFSHTLVHDLRNPLMTIGGFAQALGSVLTDADDRVRDMTRRIASSADRMNGLIEDVLALATATRSANRTSVDPLAVLREAAADMPQLHLEVGWLPELIEADRSSLYRCFQNLLENACHYAVGPGGVASARVWADETPWHWRFFVEDRGPGVSAEDRRRIFDAFERGAQVADETGTGLGLSIVAACAQAHGGSVDVEDGEHGGARFTVEIGKPTNHAVEPHEVDDVRA